MKYPWIPSFVTLSLLLGLCISPGLASEESGGHSEGEHHKNDIALFIGTTQSEEHDGDRDDPNFTLGIDYERRLSRHFGLGLLADFVIEGHREILLGMPLYLHLGKHVRLQAAPAWHKVKDSGDDGYLLRTGLSLDFDIGVGMLSPSVYYDIAEDDNLWVAGLAIGRGW